MNEIWNEVGITGVVATAAFMMASFGGHMDSVVWYAHAPEYIKRTELWYIWIVSTFLVGASILTVILEIEDFSGGSTLVHHRQLTIVFLIILTQFFISMWKVVAYAIDRNYQQGDRKFTIKERLELLSAGVTTGTTAKYYYGNPNIFVILIQASVVAALAVACLVTISADYNGTNSNIALIVFWAVETTITLIGFVYTCYVVYWWSNENK